MIEHGWKLQILLKEVLTSRGCFWELWQTVADPSPSLLYLEWYLRYLILYESLVLSNHLQCTSLTVKLFTYVLFFLTTGGNLPSTEFENIYQCYVMISYVFYFKVCSNFKLCSKATSRFLNLKSHARKPWSVRSKNSYFYSLLVNTCGSV